MGFDRTQSIPIAPCFCGLHLRSHSRRKAEKAELTGYHHHGFTPDPINADHSPPVVHQHDGCGEAEREQDGEGAGEL